MLAAAAIVWMTLDAEVVTKAARAGHGWTIGLEGRASIRPLFEYPDYQSGVLADGGFRLAHALRHDTTFTLTGRAGATHLDDWRPIFEAVTDVSWRDVVEVHAGLRHDDRLRREGPLVDFRDPTGRFFLGVRALPLRKGPFAAGAAIEYERALPGTGRLPSGVSVTALGRLRARLK